MICEYIHAVVTQIYALRPRELLQSLVILGIEAEVDSDDKEPLGCASLLFSFFDPV